MKIQLFKETPVGPEALSFRAIEWDALPRKNEFFEYDFEIYVVTKVVHAIAHEKVRIYGRMI